MKETDASFTSLQDKEQKVCGFLHWLLDAIDLNNTDLHKRQPKLHKHSWIMQSKHLVVSKNAKWACPAKLMVGAPRTPSSRDHSYGPNKCKQKWDHQWEP